MTTKNVTIYYTEAIDEIEQWAELFSQHLQLIFQSYISKDIKFTVQLQRPDTDFAGSICIAGDLESIIHQQQKLEIPSLLAMVALDDFNIDFAKNPYSFFTNEGTTTSILHSDSEKTKSLYWQQLIDLAFSLGIKNEAEPSNSLRVYLGETGKDQQANRDVIRRELNQLGYTVLPKANLPLNESEALDSIRDIIQTCAIAILFIGTDKGKTINNSQTGIVEFQHAAIQELIAIKDTPIPLMLWFEDIKRFRTDQELSYLQRIQQSVDLASGTELIQMPIEKFKQVAIQRINTERAKSIQKNISKTGNSSWYVIGDHSEKNYQDIVKTIAQSAILLEYKNDITPSEMLAQHRHNLSLADNILIYHAGQSNDWLRAKFQDILKSPGFGRSESFKNIVVVNASKSESQKDILEQYKATLPLISMDYSDISTLHKILKND